jgi:hypothetical protein
MVLGSRPEASPHGENRQARRVESDWRRAPDGGKRVLTRDRFGMMDGRSVLLVAVGALCGSVACGPVAQDVYMAKDSGGQQKTTVFHLEDEIHVHAILIGGDRGSILHVKVDGMPFEGDLYPWPNRDRLGKASVDIKFFLLPADATGAASGGGVSVGAAGAGDGSEEPAVSDPRVYHGLWPFGKFKTHVKLDDEEIAVLPFAIVPYE